MSDTAAETNIMAERLAETYGLVTTGVAKELVRSHEPSHISALLSRS
jgi:hypothetical protein